LGNEQKASGRYKAHITARGFEQKDGEHFDSTDKTSPVVNDITINIVLTINVMAGFWAEVVDVKGAFLTAEFDPKHTLYVTVPQGLAKYYPGNVVLLLKRTLHGTCQAAMQFWKKLCQVMSLINAQRSKADVCLFFQWTSVSLLIYMSWVETIIIAGKKEAVMRAKEQLKRTR
jgi:hypothetical protein